MKTKTRTAPEKKKKTMKFAEMRCSESGKCIVDVFNRCLLKQERSGSRSLVAETAATAATGAYVVGMMTNDRNVNIVSISS